MKPKLSNDQLLNEIRVKVKIEDGRLSLSVISQVQSFIKKKEAVKGEKLSKKQKMEILNLVENKSAREAEKELVKLSPETVKRTESQREITEHLTELKLVIDQDLTQQLDELKQLLSHQNPNMSYVELIRLMANKVRKGLKINKEIDNPTPTSEGTARYIPAQVRRYVWQRDKGCCQYKYPKSGRTCESKYQLQIDHIHRFRDGGSHKPGNLRLLCRAHNSWRG